MRKELIQLSFDQMDEIMSLVPRVGERRLPPPRETVSITRSPTAPELRLPLTRRRRERLGKWVLSTQKQFPLEEVLSTESASLIRLYLFPQPPDGNWLNQEDVMKEVFGTTKTRGFKDKLLWAIVRINRREYVGPRALEILKLDNYLYWIIANQELEGDMRITTIDQLQELPPERLQKICGARTIFEKLKEKMRRHFPDWDPPVVFRQELPPEQAYDF
jgi:hypothetical protein